MTETTPPKQSDLGVRAASAVVMIAVAGTALWLGPRVWFWFVVVVSLVCYGEMIRLIFKATPKLALQMLGIGLGLFYVSFAGFTIALLPGGIIYHGPHPDGGRLYGLAQVLTIVGFVVATDVGAYFSGRTIGGPKIAPSISPSKTWAGLIGGMILAGVWGVVATRLPQALLGESAADSLPLSRYFVPAFASGAILAIVAQVGDFFESWLKRKAGVKDSSRLIPGHGGVFDRIDGLLAVAVVYGVVGDWMIVGWAIGI